MKGNPGASVAALTVRCDVGYSEPRGLRNQLTFRHCTRQGGITNAWVVDATGNEVPVRLDNSRQILYSRGLIFFGRRVCPGQLDFVDNLRRRFPNIRFYVAIFLVEPE